MDTYQKEIYTIGGGFGYRIYRNGIIETDQPHTPGVIGIVRMTEKEANDFADAIISNKLNPVSAQPIL